MSTQRGKVEVNIPLADREPQEGPHRYPFILHAYPVDMSSFLTTLPPGNFDAEGIAYQVKPPGYCPGMIVQYALAHWNEYVATHAEHQRSIFLREANWLVEHESRIGDDAGGWPISFPRPHILVKGPWLSARTQGHAISVLVRAYELSGEEVFLTVARRAVRTFERDILDGGVSTPLGREGVFFEEVAVYPASHTLIGCILALFGLFDYVSLTGDDQINMLMQRGIATMHSLLDEFDMGFWTCADLLQRRLSTPAELVLLSALLEVLAIYSGCEHYEVVAARWKRYAGNRYSRLRYVLASQLTSCRRALLRAMRTVCFPRSHNAGGIHVCVPMTAFPVTGGTRAVLAGVAQVTADIWQMQYLTQYVGPHAEGYTVRAFGTARMGPWQFPAVWLYFLAGTRRLLSLMRHGADYQVILPQDGVFSAAFAALAGRLSGARVVCIDHGNLTLLKSRNYRVERIKALTTTFPSRLRRLLARLQYAAYWPSLSLLAHISARFVDHFLIPGVAGDGVEEICAQLGVPSSRVTRFASVIDMGQYAVLDAASKAHIRQQHGIAADAIIIAMVCRLAPEKGLDIALAAISLALAALAPELSTRLRVVIAGDGPLRQHVEATMRARGMSQTFLLWGETSASDVISLLSMSDVFLYTSTRGACLSMAVLEAMASACAVIATPLPMANQHMLAEGRGIIIAVEDEEQTAKALVRLVHDAELRQHMGSLARSYVARQHSGRMLRRSLLRVTSWSSLDEFLHVEKE